MTSPSQGEVWLHGTTHSITWNTVGMIGNAYLSVIHGFDPLITDYTFPPVPVSDGILTWTVPDTIPAASYYKIRLVAMAADSSYMFYTDSGTFVIGIPTHNVTITSSPAGAAIYINDLDSGYTTPHKFVLNHGTSAVFTLHLAGYSWTPESLVINNLLYNQYQNFVGTVPVLDETVVPVITEFIGCYPNPFTNKTLIKYSLCQESDVIIKIYNIKGSLIEAYYRHNDKIGKYSIEWDGTNQKGAISTSGVYFVEMSAEGFFATKKIVLLK